jgi:hypothetical protein
MDGDLNDDCTGIIKVSNNEYIIRGMGERGSHLTCDPRHTKTWACNYVIDNKMSSDSCRTVAPGQCVCHKPVFLSVIHSDQCDMVVLLCAMFCHQIDCISDIIHYTESSYDHWWNVAM